MSHDEEITNLSGNTPFEKVLEKHRSRRDVLIGGGATAATAFIAPSAMAKGKNFSFWDDGKGFLGKYYKSNQALCDFEPVPLPTTPAELAGRTPRISADYQYDTLIPWGTPIKPESGPAYSYPPTAAEQAQQVGIGHDGMTYFPMGGKGRWNRGAGNERGILCVNNEFGRSSVVLDKSFPENLEDVRTSQHAHGVTIVDIARVNGKWTNIESGYARRVHVNTPVTFSGPVAGHPLLDNTAGNDPKGTVNNCANGETPWGTYLTCEENFNGYFGANGEFSPNDSQNRYGFSANGFGYGWHVYDERFDLNNTEYANEQHRFGWIVEIDPYRPWEKPVKRTALGRFKHEGIAITEGLGGRIVGYMGDDQRFDYIYKFVSEGNWKAMRAKGKSPLDHGKLYCARFKEDGTGEWLELTIDNPALAAVFADQAEVLVRAREAADILGATPMDRPEWTAVAPNGEVYCTLTNNSRRTEPAPANPLVPNADGHIIKWKDSQHHTGTTFTWEIFLIAQDTHGTEESLSDPDGLAIDPDGRVFIETDGGQKDGLQNQLLVVCPETKAIKRLFAGVSGDEITGFTMTPDRRTLFINTQHPGNGDPGRTNFPAPDDGVTVPRDCTIVVTRKDGGIIGS